MSWALLRGGQRMVLDEPDARELRDLLLSDEIDAIAAGALVAELGGAVLSLDSPLPAGGEILLRVPQPASDQAAFLYRINSDGERVRIGELLDIRRFEAANGQEVWGQTLAQIRHELAVWEDSVASRPRFFGSAAAGRRALQALAEHREVPQGPSRRRRLRGQVAS
ncbi:MAG: hypothetical protein KDA24_21570 [Deltaproteobacteria bacterium]|nr:hypothetical protein [Deltaproteobacteria bacterium]